MHPALVETLILTAVYGAVAWRFVLPRMRQRQLAAIDGHERHLVVVPQAPQTSSASNHRSANLAPGQRHLRLVSNS